MTKYYKHIETFDGVTKTLFYQPDIVGTNICIPECVSNTNYDLMMEGVLADPPTNTIEEVDDTIVLTYADKRRNAYPNIGDQLDMLWHAVDGDDTLKTTYADFHTAIKAVKDANPKG